MISAPKGPQFGGERPRSGLWGLLLGDFAAQNGAGLSFLDENASHFGVIRPFGPYFGAKEGGQSRAISAANIRPNRTPSCYFAAKRAYLLRKCALFAAN